MNPEKEIGRSLHCRPEQNLPTGTNATYRWTIDGQQVGVDDGFTVKMLQDGSLPDNVTCVVNIITRKGTTKSKLYHDKVAKLHRLYSFLVLYGHLAILRTFYRIVRENSVKSTRPTIVRTRVQLPVTAYGYVLTYISWLLPLQQASGVREREV